MAQFRRCMNCGESFELEHSFVDYICDFCYEQLYEEFSECSDCGAQFHQDQSLHQLTCSDFANNPCL